MFVEVDFLSAVIVKPSFVADTLISVLSTPGISTSSYKLRFINEVRLADSHGELILTS